MIEEPGGPPPSPFPPPEPPPYRPSLLFRIFSLGAGLFLGLCGATICCLFGVGFVDRLRLPIPVFLVAAGLLFLVPLVLLLTRRPRAPFQVGLVIGLSLTGLIMGACGTLMR